MQDALRARLLAAPNLNHFWSALIVDDLVTQGLTTFCICPGSRSTPLTWAAAQHPDAETIVHFDERGTVYHALGIAKATRTPVAFICTSGTAVANAFPAVVEASTAHVPLILLTADRPPELQNTGANQTIDQVNIFGAYPRLHVGYFGPAALKDPKATRNTLQAAVTAANAAPPGPVHLNCMFDEPLAPILDPDWNAEEALATLDLSEESKTAHHPEFPVLPREEQDQATTTLRAAQRGLIVVGNLATREEADTVDAFAHMLGWPLIPDITSQLRLSARRAHRIAHAALLLKTPSNQDRLAQADTILHIGGAFTSKPLLSFLDSMHGRPYIRILDHNHPVDPPGRVTQRLVGSIGEICARLGGSILSAQPGDWSSNFAEDSATIQKTIVDSIQESDPITEPALAQVVTAVAPAESVLFLGNSMPIRDADQYGAPDGPGPLIATNRGASGIDGNIATAAGYAHALRQPVTALLGDLAALHDLNSLALLKELPAPVILIIVNNDGGGIFHFLPIAQHQPHFEPYFGTPHGMNFAPLAQGFQLSHHTPTTIEEFKQTYTTALAQKRSCIIEIRTDRDQNLRIHRELDQRIADALNQ